MPGLALFMQRLVMDRPVIDKTALKGKYDFDLVWRPDESQSGGKYSGQGLEDRPDIYHALAGLGLKLQPSKAVADLIIVDSVVERPDENRRPALAASVVGHPRNAAPGTRLHRILLHSKVPWHSASEANLLRR